METAAYGKLDSLTNAMHWGMNDSIAEILYDRNKEIIATDSIGSLWKEVNEIALPRPRQAVRLAGAQGLYLVSVMGEHPCSNKQIRKSALAMPE